MSAGRVIHTGERDRMRYCGEGVTEDELGNNLLKHIKDGLGRARGPSRIRNRVDQGRDLGMREI